MRENNIKNKYILKIASLLIVFGVFIFGFMFNIVAHAADNVFMDNVGIQNTAPSHLLTIGNSSSPATNGFKMFVDEYTDVFSIFNLALAANMLRIDTDDLQFLIDEESYGMKVGIGTTTPNAVLDVYAPSGNEFTVYDGYYQYNIGNSVNNNAGPNNNYFSIWKNASTVYYNNRIGSHVFQVSGNELMRIGSNGNVGIGITSPDTPLHIKAPTNATSMNLGSYSGIAFAIEKSDSEQYGLYFGRSGNGDSWIQAGRTDVSTAYNLSFQASGGNVGIGTTTPQAKLVLDDGDFQMTDNKSIKLENSSASTTLLIGNYADGLSFDYNNGQVANLAVEGDIKGNRLCIEESCKDTWGAIAGNLWTDAGTYIYANNNPASDVVVTDSGNLGIGTSTPTEKLDVVGNINIDSNSAYQINNQDILKIWNSNSLGLGIDSGNSGSQVVNIGYQAGNNNSSFNQTAVGVRAGNNNTGIGQTSVGLEAGQDNSGNYQTVFGNSAGKTNSGIYQTAIGYNTGQSNTGNYQTAVGYNAGNSNTRDYQTVLGNQAGNSNTGHAQTAVGSAAGQGNTGARQTAIGSNAGNSNSGNHQIAIGNYTGLSNTGNQVIGIGYEATRNNSGNDVVALGYQAGLNNTVANQFIVKQANVNSIPLIQGDFSTGNVGIGSTTPQYKLDVNDSDGIRVYDSVDGGEITIGNSFSDDWASVKGQNLSNIGWIVGIDEESADASIPGFGSTGNTDINFYTASTERIRINGSTGNVGIGTSTPDVRLYVATPAGTNAEIGIQSGTSPKWGIYQDDTTDDLRFWNTDNRMTITNEGNVGIGTTPGGSRLTISRNFSNTSGTGLYTGITESMTSNGTVYDLGQQTIVQTNIPSGITNSGYLIGQRIQNFHRSAGTLNSLQALHIQYGNYTGGSGVTSNAYGVLIDSYRTEGTVTNSHAIHINDVMATNDYAIYQTAPNDTSYFAGDIGIGDSTPDAGLKLDVAGKVGATEYCDSDGNNCTTAGSLGGVTTYLALTDTPASFTANAIPYTNSGGTALLHSGNFAFTGSQLTVNSGSLDSALTVQSSDTATGINFTDSAGTGSIYYWGANNYFGTNSKLSVGTQSSPGANSLRVEGDADISSQLAVGANASIGTNQTLQIQQNYNLDANTFQIYSNTTETSPTLTADRTSYGIDFIIYNNKTEDIGNGYDSDARAVYGQVVTNGTHTFRSNYGVYGYARNDSTASSDLGNLYGVYGFAYQNASSGTIPYAYGVYGLSQGDSSAGSTSVISNAFGGYFLTLPLNSNITAAYGSYNSAQTNNSYSGDITNAYGSYNRVRVDSDDGGDITTGRAGYFTTSRRTGANLMNTAYGIQVDANDGVTTYGIRVDVDDTDPTTNYGIYLDVDGATSNNYGIFAEDGDWILDADGNGVAGGTGAGGDLILGEGQDLELYHNGTNSYIMNNTGDLYITDSGTDDVILSSNGGNVGIGTNVPTTKLDVTGGGIAVHNSDKSFYNGFGVPNANWAYLNTDAPKWYINKEIRVDSGLIGSYNQDLQLRTSGTTRMTINNSTGNMGIGDSTPDHTLDVAGNIGLNSSGYINFSDTDGSSGYGFRDNSGTIQYKNSGGTWNNLGGSSTYLSLSDTPASFTANAIPYTNSGGTALLHSSNFTYNGTDMVLQGDIGVGATPGGSFANNKSIAFGDSDTGIRQDGDGELEIWNNNSESIHIDSSGNVGIGQDTPLSLLHIGTAANSSDEYLIIDEEVGAPPAADCDSNAKRGRMIIDAQNNRLYICMGLIRGWDYVPLTN